MPRSRTFCSISCFARSTSALAPSTAASARSSAAIARCSASFSSGGQLLDPLLGRSARSRASLLPTSARSRASAIAVSARSRASSLSRSIASSACSRERSRASCGLGHPRLRLGQALLELASARRGRSSRTRASAPRAAISAVASFSSASATLRSASARVSWASASAPSRAVARRSASSARCPAASNRLSRPIDRRLLGLLGDRDRLLGLAPRALGGDAGAGRRVTGPCLAHAKLLDQRRWPSRGTVRWPRGRSSISARICSASKGRAGSCRRPPRSAPDPRSLTRLPRPQSLVGGLALGQLALQDLTRRITRNSSTKTISRGTL